MSCDSLNESHFCSGAPFANAISVFNFYKENRMASEDVAAGKVKQIKGKANDIAGAIKGDTGQQIKGKVQKAVGKVQEKLGKKNPD